MLEVFDASTASGSVMTRSSSEKIWALTASSSTTASITSCRSARSLSSVVKVSWSSARSRSRSVTLPALTPRSSDFTMRLRPAVISASVVSNTVTPTPARTATSAIPDPICPAPTTPTRWIAASLTISLSSYWHACSAIGPAQGRWAGPMLSTSISDVTCVHSVGASLVTPQWNWPSSVEPVRAVVDEFGSTVVAMRSK